MIEYPVRLTFDYQIVDARNQVLIPELTWRNDAAHLSGQKEIGELVVTLMNANWLMGASDTPPATGKAVLAADRPKRVSKAVGHKK